MGKRKAEGPAMDGPQQPPAASPSPSANVSVNVSGTRSVGVGNMTGGNISTGNSPATGAAEEKPSSAGKPSGAPRWTYVVGALVGAAGLVWAVASHFIPKAETPKQPAASAPLPSYTASANASHAGNVGASRTADGTAPSAGLPAKGEPARQGATPTR